MKVTVEKEMQTVTSAESVHPLMKEYHFISNKNVNYEDLTAFEAGAMALVFILSIATGVIMSLPIS